MSAASKAVGSRSFADAGKQLAVVKQVMVDTQEFWVSRNIEDAVKANRDSIARIVEVEQAFAATPAPAPEGGVTLLRSIEARCKVCHDKYRERDAAGNWVLKGV